MKRLLIALLLLSSLGPLGVHTSVAAVRARTATTTCLTPLTLVLRPGTVPGIGAQNGPPAWDLPPNPVIVHLPLYPSAIGSTGFIPTNTFQSLPPSYRKIALTTFALPVGFKAASAWYQTNMANCGYSSSGASPLQKHGGITVATFFFTSHDNLRMVSFTFRPISQRLTLVEYLAQMLDLPPRPAASYLHGPFVRVYVLYRSHGVVPPANRVRRFTINWQPTIKRLVDTINMPLQIHTPRMREGGGLTILTESSTLSFVRADGGIRRVHVGGVFNTVIVGHTRALDDTVRGVQFLVDRLVDARCRGNRSCT